MINNKIMRILLEALLLLLITAGAFILHPILGAITILFIALWVTPK